MRKQQPYEVNYKKSIVYLAIGILLFISSAYTQSSLNKTLSQGVDFSKNNMNFEGNSFLAPEFLSNYYGSVHYEISPVSDFSKVKKILILKNISDELGIYASWKDTGTDDIISSKISLVVNNNTIDITTYLSNLKENEIGLIVIPVQGFLVEGRNEIIIQFEEWKNGESLTLHTEGIFKTEVRSFVFRNSWRPIDNEFLIFPYKENPIWFKILFKLGFLFKIVGFILLFIAVFGMKEAKAATKKPRTVTFIVLYSSFIMFMFSILDSFWYIFSTIVAKGTFYLLKFTGFMV